MPRRLMLYNYDNAIKYPCVVVVEGAVDVWSVGKYAVALFGKKASSQQLQLLMEGWENGVIFVMLDGDAHEDVINLCEGIKTNLYSGIVIPVHLQADKDPGNYNSDYIKQLLFECARAHGIEDVFNLKRKTTNVPSKTRIPYRVCEAVAKRDATET